MFRETTWIHLGNGTGNCRHKPERYARPPSRPRVYPDAAHGPERISKYLLANLPAGARTYPTILSSSFVTCGLPFSRRVKKHEKTQFINYATYQTDLRIEGDLDVATWVRVIETLSFRAFGVSVLGLDIIDADRNVWLIGKLSPRSTEYTLSFSSQK